MQRPELPATLVSAAVAALFVFAAAPGVHWLDSGEFSASVFLLGIAHPTGFSLLHVLGKGATLIPIGSVAFRLNLFAAACTTLAIALTTILIHEVILRPADDPSPTPSENGDVGPVLGLTAVICSTLAIVGALNVAMHAAVTEIYSLNIALIAAQLVLFVRWQRRGDARWLYASALLAGITLGAHATGMMVAALLGLLSLLPLGRPETRRRLVASWRHLAPIAAAFVVVGALVLLYLPLASLRRPYHEWVPAEQWRGFVSEVSAKTIRAAFDDQINSWNFWIFFEYLRRHVLLLFSEAPAAMALALPGCLWLWRRERPLALALPLIAVADALFSAKINPMGIADWQTATPSLLALGTLAGFGLLFAVERVRSLAARYGRVVGAGLLGLAALGVALLLALGWLHRLSDKRLGHEYAGYEFLLAQATQLGPNAALFVVSDSSAGGWLYLQSVENRRPDALVLVRQFLDSRDYLATLPRRGVSPAWQKRLLRDIGAEDRMPRLVAFALRRQPVFWEPGDGRSDRLIWNIAACSFPLCELALPQKKSPSPLAILRGFRRYAERQPTLSELSKAQLGAAFRYFASFLAARDRLDGAGALLDTALKLNGEDARTQLNRGVIAERRGDLANALRHTRWATELDRLSLRAWLNLAAYQRLLRRPNDALESLDTAERIEPGNARAALLRALLAIDRSDRDGAIDVLRRARQRHPTDPRVKKLLETLERPTIER
ncbi:MAG: DUF2723 domain-containing protein [Myxococcales bacterium]|nr:DUF2723 domain-containing protein [Myxococcales bacterium]